MESGAEARAPTRRGKEEARPAGGLLGPRPCPGLHFAGGARDGLGKGRGWKSPSISSAGERRGSPSARELMKTVALFF